MPPGHLMRAKQLLVVVVIGETQTSPSKIDMVSLEAGTCKMKRERAMNTLKNLISCPPKFQATVAPRPREKEIVELFRKVQA